MNAHDRLRAYLGEEIPPAGTDADTLFTNAEIEDILSFATGPESRALYGAAAEGWERKASKWAELVTNQTGGTTRNLSDLHVAATQQADRFRALHLGRRTARIGRVVRPGTTLR